MVVDINASKKSALVPFCMFDRGIASDQDIEYQG